MRTLKIYLQIQLGFIILGAAILVFSYSYGWVSFGLILPIMIQIWVILRIERDIKMFDSLVHSVDKLESKLALTNKKIGVESDAFDENTTLPPTHRVQLEYLILVDGVFKDVTKTLAIPRRYFTLDEIVLHIKENLVNYDLPPECKIIEIERK